jgi:hypothetical protein
MSRTQGKFASDIGWNDGQIFLSALDIDLVSGTATFTRNASGDYSWNLGASATCVFAVALSSLLFRYGVQDDLQENYGAGPGPLLYGSQGEVVGGYTTLTTASGAVGSNVNLAVLSSVNFNVGNAVLCGAQKTYVTAIPDSTHITVQSITATLASGSVITQNLFTTPAGVTGRPPFTGQSQLTPVTSPRPKGIQFREIYPWYLVTGAALTTNTIGITKTVAANATANAVTNILANAANNLQTATQATPYLTPIQIASPAFQTTKYASYNMEWDVTTGSGGAARVYGIYMDIGYNWN